MLKFSEYSYIFVCSVSPVSRESIADSEQGWAADSALSDHGIGGLIPTSSDDGSNGSVRDVSAEMGVDNAFFGNVYTPRTGGEVESDNDLDTVSITSCSSVTPGEAHTIFSHLIIARAAGVFNELPTLSQRASYAASHPEAWCPDELLSKTRTVETVEPVTCPPLKKVSWLVQLYWLIIETVLGTC